MEKMNVYAGKNGIKAFLNPENHVTPLVEIPKQLNPFDKKGVRIFMKLQTLTPLMNVKLLPAYEMLKNASGKERKLVESSSGNMAFSLSVLGRVMGYEKTEAVISSEVGLTKLQALLLSGAEVIVNEEPICPNPNDKKSGISLAKRKAAKEKGLNLNQYANRDNPQGHCKVCGKQIADQMKGDVQLFCTCLGTTGSLVGITKVLKKRNPALKTLGVVRKPNNPVPGPRTLGLLNMIEFDWKSCCDDMASAGSEESYRKSMELCRYGLLAGPSTGLAFSGLLKHLGKLKREGKLDGLKNKKGRINCVFLACDLPFLYMDDYFKYIPKKDFPKIKNEKALRNKITFRKEKKKKVTMTAREIMKKVFKMTAKKLWKEKNPAVQENFILVDMRPKTSFDCGHIPKSINMEEKEMAENRDELTEKWQNSGVIFICEYGELSYYMAEMFANRGIKAFSLEGGFLEWSRLGYPRVSLKCKIKR